jgi:probable F420-dependent oxidoreductase
MADIAGIRERMGRLGVWFFTEMMAAGPAAEFAARLESLGYGALWLPETVGRDPFAHIAYLATETERLVFATGIANIHHRHPGMMKQAQHTLAEQTGDRFLLGIGVSHAPLVAGLRKLTYDKPLSQMRDYLTGMDESFYAAVGPSTEPARVVAALGPKMLELSASAADGAHPYWTTPEHTAQAREILGPDKLLCVEQKVVVETDAAAARAAGRGALKTYAKLPNYRNNWLRLGFTPEDVDVDGGSDRLIDALVAWGTVDQVRARIDEHFDAGATHVCIQPIAAGEPAGTLDWNALEALAPA